jgi:hypothetical protein
MTAQFGTLPYGARDLADGTSLPRREDPAPADPYAFDYQVPNQQIGQPAQAVQQLRDVAFWTEWSHRVLAKVIGSTHPVVAEGLRGSASFLERSDESRHRLEEAHNITSRIYVLAGNDPSRTAYVLEQPSLDGRSAKDYLIDGHPNEAYLAAIDALRPRHSSGLVTGRRPMDPRRANKAVLDEE